MKIWAIAKVGLRECVRHRGIYVIVLMALIFIFLGKGCNAGTVKGGGIFFDQTSLQRMAMSVAFHGIGFWSMMLCGLVAAGVLTKELEDGTAVMVLCRPVGRASFVAGKLLSVLIISLITLFVLAGVYCVLLYMDTGTVPLRIFISIGVMSLNLLLYALMIIFFSLFLPRLIAPLFGMFVYVISFLAAVPFYFKQLKIFLEPSDTVIELHRLLPRFGDLHFLGASFIDRVPSFSDMAVPLASVSVYCVLLWSLIILVFQRKQI